MGAIGNRPSQNQGCGYCGMVSPQNRTWKFPVIRLKHFKRSTLWDDPTIPLQLRASLVCLAESSLKTLASLNFLRVQKYFPNSGKYGLASALIFLCRWIAMEQVLITRYVLSLFLYRVTTAKITLFPAFAQYFLNNHLVDFLGCLFRSMRHSWL